MKHQAQLRICHEKLGFVPDRMTLWQRAKHVGRRTWRWCDLPAHAWCFDDGMYVCEVHFQANHDLHRTQLVSEEE